MKWDKVLNEIKRGNKKVLEKLYSRYRNDFIYFSLKNYNIGIERATDIFMDSLLTFYENALNDKIINKNVKIKTYLFKIGVNKSKKEIRDKKRVKYQETDEKYFDSKDQIESKIIYDESLSLLMKMIEKLPENCKKVLSLYYFEKLGYEEITKIMKYSGIFTTRSMKHKCFSKLRKILLELYETKIINPNK